MSKQTTSLAQALVYAVTYLILRESGDDEDDVGALESIAGICLRMQPQRSLMH